MPSALELFYQRRSRVARDPPLQPSSSSSISGRDFDHHRRRSHRHGRHDCDGCDHHHLRTRYPHLRPQTHNPRPSSAFPAQEHPSVQLDVGPNHFVSDNGDNTDSLRSTSRPRLTSDDRLPGTVLLARARLLERLRGVSLFESRHRGGASFRNNREHRFDDESRVVDAGDWGTDYPTGRSNGVSSFVDSTVETERVQFVRGSDKNKPPGLSSEALDLLQSEVFSSLDKGTKGEKGSQVSCDCSICLESFSEGDELVRLPCDHRFHFTCLEPWVRTCGDCPCCRKDIVVSSCKNVTESHCPF